MLTKKLFSLMQHQESNPASHLAQQEMRLENVIRMMNHHPSYLEPFLKSHNFILRGDGPLSYAYRHYIAIMAAARHQCSYLVNAEREEFLACGGEKEWLNGLDYIPQKLKDLNEINKILAHQPWLLNKTHFEKLTKGTDSWSLSELVHAIVILANIHALSSFVFSCHSNVSNECHNLSTSDEKENGHHVGHSRNVTLQDSHVQGHAVHGLVDVTVGTISPDTGSPTLSSSPNGLANVDMIIEKMHDISEQQRAGRDHDQEMTAEELALGFNRVEEQSAQLSVPNGGNSPPRPKDGSEREHQDEMNKFIEDAQFCYQDFAKKREETDVPTFRIQDCSWDDHGFTLVNRYYSDVGNLLDEKFKVCYNLTYFTMGSKSGVDTSMFRRAVWNYIQSMYGIRHDDYDYRDVNELLERQLKTYIKTLCCFPHRITKCDFNNVMRGFRKSEKIHVNLMILEARLQAELLYALRAIMRFMT